MSPLYPIVNIETGEEKELQMTISEWEKWRDENKNLWKRDWTKGCASSGEIGEIYDKLKKSHPGWNDVLHRVSRVPKSNVKPV